VKKQNRFKKHFVIVILSALFITSFYMQKNELNTDTIGNHCIEYSVSHNERTPRLPIREAYARYAAVALQNQIIVCLQLLSH